MVDHPSRRAVVSGGLAAAATAAGTAALATSALAGSFNARRFGDALLKMPMSEWADQIKDLDKAQKIAVFNRIKSEVGYWKNKTSTEMTSSWNRAFKRGRWDDITNGSYVRNVPFDSFRQLAIGYNNAIGEARIDGSLTLEKFNPLRAQYDANLDKAYDDVLKAARSTFGYSEASLSTTRTADIVVKARRNILRLG